MTEMMGTANNFCIIPNEPVQHTDLLNVDRKTKEALRLRHRLFINGDWEANTIATKTVETMIMSLHSHIRKNGVKILKNQDANLINFYDLLEISATNKKNDQAEKVGNINVVFRPGNSVDAIISNETPPDKREIEYIAPDAAYTIPDDTELTNAMLVIDKAARRNISDKHSILLAKSFQAIATTFVFLENLYEELVRKLVLSGKNSASINFNDIIEFHATKKGEGCVINLRPGMGAKLIIKSDNATESEDDDLDNVE